MPEAQHDWGAIEDFYVEGEVNDAGERTWPEPARVAHLFDVPERYVREHLRAAEWDAKRAAAQVNHQKVLANKRARDAAKEAKDFDQRAMQVAKVGLQLVTMRSGQILKAAAEAQKAEAEAKQRGEVYEDYGVSSIDAKELNALAAAAEGWQRVGAKALGEVEAVTRVELTGPGGAPMESRTSVQAQLQRDDGDRIVGVVSALARSGLLGALGGVTGPQALPTRAREVAEDGIGEEDGG